MQTRSAAGHAGRRATRWTRPDAVLPRHISPRATPATLRHAIPVPEVRRSAKASRDMARMFTTVHHGAIADEQLASLPDGATVTVLIVEEDGGELDESTERELEARVIEADRGDSFVDASEVLRRLDARRAKS